MIMAFPSVANSFAVLMLFLTTQAALEYLATVDCVAVLSCGVCERRMPSVRLPSFGVAFFLCHSRASRPCVHRLCCVYHALDPMPYLHTTAVRGVRRCNSRKRRRRRGVRQRRRPVRPHPDNGPRAVAPCARARARSVACGGERLHCVVQVVL